MQIHLSRILQAKKMQQKELAQLTHIRAATINNLYNQTAIKVRLEYLDRICTALDCPIGELLEHESVNLNELLNEKES